MGVDLREARYEAKESLQELAALAGSAGAIVVDQMIQKRERLDATFFIGKGKVDELAERVRMHDADVIIHHSTAPRLITSDCNIPLIPAGGFTFFCVDANSKAEILPFADGTPSHVKMDVLVSRATAGDNAHFRAFVAHELGHVLGIGAHSGNIADLMFGAPSRLTPSTADVETLLYVLGQTPTVRF